MPVKKCNNGKYQIGNGPCVFGTQEKARKAYRGYLFQKHGARASEMEGVDIPDNLGEEENVR